MKTKKVFCIIGILSLLISVLLVWQHKKTEKEVMTGIVKKIIDEPNEKKVIVVFEDVVFTRYDKDGEVIETKNQKGEVCIFRNISPKEYCENFLFLKVNEKAKVIKNKNRDGNWEVKIKS